MNREERRMVKLAMPTVDDIMCRKADMETVYPPMSGGYVKEVRHKWPK